MYYRTKKSKWRDSKLTLLDKKEKKIGDLKAKLLDLKKQNKTE